MSLKDSKKLVLTYSRADENYGVGYVEVGNTERMGDMICAYTGAKKYHIEPAVPYPKEYKPTCDQALIEKNEGARPAVANQLNNLDDYDTIFLGYPIWWGNLPMAAFTFIEKLSFEGKTVIPFCTHEGSGENGTFRALKEKLTGAKFLRGLAVYGSSVDSSKNKVEKWLKDLGF